jgi:tetratricopeptide (TPR) repeat protein
MKPKCAIAVIFFLIAAVRGQNETDLWERYKQELKSLPNSSLTHFRIGEIHLQKGNFQSAANEFREALNGDLQPMWVEVWAHLNLGKIFDMTGQRNRAVNEYIQAQRTKDNTRGALDEATLYLQIPYPRK